MTWLRHIFAITILPGMVTIFVPLVILNATQSLNLGWGLAFPLSLIPYLAGLLLLVAGLTLMYQTISLFALVGKGTLAPWDATQRLVVRGVYRYTRNPMITGVFCVLLGEAALAGSLSIFYWAGLFILINMIYMPLSEEPGLARRFGNDYALYKQNVPCWIPRLTPWDASALDKPLTQTQKR
jgi:protein-S-isoprenylcysteine O-methyltransferase Ste14